MVISRGQDIDDPKVSVVRKANQLQLAVRWRQIPRASA